MVVVFLTFGQSQASSFPPDSSHYAKLHLSTEQTDMRFKSESIVTADMISFLLIIDASVQLKIYVNHQVIFPL